MLISKTDLTKAASRFSRIPSGEQLFNPFEDVKCLDGSIYYPDVIWLMGNCPKLQTNEGLGGYIATKPSAFYIYLLMAECRFAQTPEVFAAFLEAKPDAHVLAYFRRDCREFANTPEVIAAIGLPTATWVSITEQHPEIGVDVLLFDQHTQEMKVGYLVETTTRQTANGIAVSCEWRGGDVFINITHWMPLPQPPKNDASKP